MHNEIIGIKKCFWLIIVLLPFLMIPSILSGMETDKTLNQNSISQGEYVLVIKGDHIALKAKDASLKDILEEIGRRMKIDIVANIPREQKITIEFDMMYLEDALKRFKTNYAYITKSGKERGKITKIVAVPKGVEKMLPNKFEYNPQPPIQEYEQEPQPPIQEHEQEPQPTAQEYNPQPPIQKSEHEPHSSTVTEYGSQSSSSVTDNDSQPSSTVTDNESQSSSTVTEDDTQSPAVNSDYDPQPSIK